MGIAAHRDGTLTPKDRTAVQGIPCTTIARTLLDMAGVKDRHLRHAISQAEVERKFDLREIEELLGRSKGRRGVRRLKLEISLHDPREQATRQALEARFFRFCRKFRLVRPEVNSHLLIDGISMMPDFLWREARLIVEADSRRVHGTVSAFEKDRRRDQVLTAAGWTVIRCTWRQLRDEPEALAHTIRTLLARSHG
jgi:very-short-patch-repair endonuclease